METVKGREEEKKRSKRRSRRGEEGRERKGGREEGEEQKKEEKEGRGGELLSLRGQCSMYGREDSCLLVNKALKVISHQVAIGSSRL